MPDRAGMILYNARGQVLILRDINSGKWSFPKGKREYGETPFHTAVRECAEESGLQLGVDYMATPTIHMRGGGGIYYAGAVLSQQPCIRVQPREITDWAWMDPAAPNISTEQGNLGVRQFLARVQRAQDSVSPPLPLKEEVSC
jgi:8-oxo-dGTP pyrophosphatase MutT (NUDIX family)